MQFPLLRLHWCLPLAALLFFASPAVSQIIAYNFDTNHWRGDRLESLGIDAAGNVWVAGEHYNGEESVQVLLQFTGDGFEVIPLSLSPAGDSITYTRYGLRLSRDARYVVASVPVEESDQTVLWSRENPWNPQFLGEFIPGRRTSGRDVASTPHGPVVVGTYTYGTFLWTPSTGFRAWMTNSGFWPLRFSYHINADGTKWVGQQSTLNGTVLDSLPFVGTQTRLEILESDGSNLAASTGISPNGEHVVGHINVRGTVWKKKKAHTLSFGTNAFILTSVTDSGIAGGSSSLGGVIYDSHGKKVELFEEWWSSKHPTVPLPAPVRRVVDIQEHEGDLYCLIDLEDVATEFQTTALVITPLKKPKKPKK